MLSILSILSMFTLLVICSFVFFLAARTKIPYTVLLVFVGLIIVPISAIPPLTPFLGFLTDFNLTPELLFYIFLPTLIFESAYNMNVRNMVDNVWSISILSIVGLLISAFLISSILYFLLPLIGLNIPFIILLLFASIISATDPVAVLALFKEYKAPKRLTLIFEGESLFNDGTAVALFLVVLAIAQNGFDGVHTILGGIETFGMMIIFGTFFGIFMALIFSKFLRYTRSNEFVSVTLLIVSAHIVFILSELINQHGLYGLSVHVSPIIATTFAALFLGNYTRHSLSPKGEEYVEKSVSHAAYIINSLVFILVGMLFATTKIEYSSLILPVIITIFVVAFSRAVSVYLSIYPLNKLRVEENIPTSWQHLLSWGSLRGALAIIIVLLIPDTFTIAGWEYSFTPKEFLIALTSGCILTTLFVKATTIKWMLDKFNCYDYSRIEEVSKVTYALFSLINQKNKLREFSERGFINFKDEKEIAQKDEEINTKTEKLKKEQKELIDTWGEKVFVHELHLRAINIEEKYLKELYVNNEISEKVYRRIRNKLSIQKEKIEMLELDQLNTSTYTDKKDVFDRFMNIIYSPFDKKRNELSITEALEYTRAQSIISRKVVKNLTEINNMFTEKIYPESIFNQVIGIYEKYKTGSNQKFLNISSQDQKEVNEHISYLNEHALEQSKEKALHYLVEKGLLKESDIANL